MVDVCVVSWPAEKGKLAVRPKFGYNTAISFSGILSGNDKKIIKIIPLDKMLKNARAKGVA